MKRVLATVMTVFLLLGLLVCGVSAESTFEFKETNREIFEELLLIYWNFNEAQAAGDTVEIVSVKIGGQTEDSDEEDGMISVELSSVLVGEHELRVNYTVNGQAREPYLATFVKPGDQQVTLSLTINERGNPVVTVKDATGQPVKDYDVTFTTNTDYSGKTNSQGVCKLNIELSEGDTVVCKGERQAVGAVTYAEAQTVQATYQKATTTTTQAPTTTTLESETTTTLEGEGATTTLEGETTTTESKATTTTKQPSANANATTASSPVTHKTIRGAGTTAQKDGRIALNVSLDENVLAMFGLKKADFANKARLHLTKDDYNNLTGRSSHQLMLNVLTAAKEPSVAQINAAIAGVSKFSTYDEEHRKAITFDLSFLKIDSNTGEDVPVSALPINTTYIVQLPVPAEMKDCKMLAITFFNGDELAEPMVVTVQGGTFSLEINSLEAYTLIGFGAEEARSGGSNSVFLIVLLIVGILLLVAAAVLVYLFILRKPAPKATVAPAFVPESFDENDIFSGRDDISEINRRPTDNGNS